MKLSQNFFDVMQTAIREATWKGSAVEDVVRAMDELNQLYQENQSSTETVGVKLPPGVVAELQERARKPHKKLTGVVEPADEDDELDLE